MIDIILEILLGAIVGVILWALYSKQRHTALSQIDGWRHISTGFGLLFFGTLIDITDNFESLNKFIIIGNTPAQAFLEKVFGSFLGFSFLALGVLRWLPKVIKHEESMKTDLQQANTKVKLLSGFLPICASCKKIRDDAGYWTQIEKYIHDHSEAEFSHSICPECAEKLYPDITINRD